MDNATFTHLQRWADRYLREEDREKVVDDILVLWDSGDDEDRARWADQGWPHVARLVGASV